MDGLEDRFETMHGWLWGVQMNDVASIPDHLIFMLQFKLEKLAERQCSLFQLFIFKSNRKVDP